MPFTFVHDLRYGDNCVLPFYELQVILGIIDATKTASSASSLGHMVQAGLMQPTITIVLREGNPPH